MYFIPCLLLLASCYFPGTVRPTLKIGLVAPFEGRYRYVGYDVIYAVRLAVREANAAGGVGGYGVELVAYDDGADPEQAAEQARKLSLDPTVIAVIGHFRAETTAASAGVYDEAGIPLVSPGLVDPYADPLAAEMLRWLDAAGIDRAALLTVGGPLGAALRRDPRVGPAVSLGQAGGLDEILAADVGAVLCDADPVTAGEALAALRGVGWEGLFLGGPELAAADFTAVAGEAAGGTRFVTPWPFPQDVPGRVDFVTAYQEMGPHVSPPGPLALPAYEATQAILEALAQDIAAHGAPTQAGTAEALAAAVPREGRSLYWYRVGQDGVLQLAGD